MDQQNAQVERIPERLPAAYQSLIDKIREHGPIRGRALADTMGVSQKEVGRMICSMRKAYVNGRQNAMYVHLSKSGYTLEETSENLKYESIRRLKMGTSIIMNGKYVFSRCRSISLVDYNRLKIEFRPTSVKTMNLLSDTIGSESKTPEIVS